MNKMFDEFGQEIGQGGRQAARHRVMFMAALARDTGQPLGQVRVRDISSSGLMAETGLPLRLGEKVQVDLRGIGAVTGAIVRRTPNSVAIKFDIAIDPLLTRQKV